MNERRTLPVPEGLDHQRVDAGLAKLLGFSRSFAAEVADSGGVTLDGVTVGKSERLRSGAMLLVDWAPRHPPVVVPIELADLRIAYDDEDIVVVDKPPGVAAHPSTGWDGPTVLGALAGAGYQLATSGAAERQGIVHRLDVGTSGLMVVAKSEAAYRELKRQFHDREVDKTYAAVARGLPDPVRGTIDAPLGRHPRSDWKFAVVSGGRPSITHYETLEAFRSASLVEVHLETGRTHQIRVHFQATGHPLVGDPLYGPDPALAARLGLRRQWLHARRLAFVHPVTGAETIVESEPPEDLRHALAQLAAD